ncbi:ATP-dependent helicase [Hoyosella subflava]|uniref:DNA 3'-5' helicase n=1 Tax=Hoyosella subflava (strain DSM 45089 / JCM 17490 / NBRC 109087 / DQS3-9A1) TaxID=443218 RepID=F6ESP2_HOYSD|nr:ATP-dependent helicase [Hoyosella subflava]AEF43163.1 ATP-dependent DNA helicase PcrA [Hoyosella subflava DQS3-9A1]
MTGLRRAIAELETNPRQREAFHHEGHCVVLAPPGSGKTKLLTTKAVWLANNAVAPDRGLACITLTNPAAAELRTRIRRLGQTAGRTVFVGTVHSFAWSHIIRPFASAAGYPKLSKYALAPRGEANAAMREAIRRVFSSHEDTRYVDSTVRRHRKLCLTEEEWTATGPGIRAVALEYERLLRGNDYVDFDDVIAMAARLVEEHLFVRTVLHARYPYLMVDEYQDLAPGLHRIVTALSFDAGNTTLFAVGDPDQAIYGWTGTRPELLLELAGRESVHRVDLRINYRCGALIAAAGRRILGSDGPEAVTSREGGSVTTRCEPRGLSAQANYIAGRILELQADEVPLHEIAVLAPTHDDCDELVTALRSHDIPVAWRADAYSSTPLTTTLESFAAWASCGREDSGYKLGDLLDQWQQLGDWEVLRVGTDDVVTVLLSAAADTSAGEFVETVMTIMESTGALNALRSDDANELVHMREALDPSGEMSHFSVRDLGRLRLRDGRVEVSTMSASKGLEFDHVFIAALEQGKLPFFNSARGSAAWNEDRRKFYVSFTRARETVEVLYSGWYMTKWGSRKSNGPSVFLRESGLV